MSSIRILFDIKEQSVKEKINKELNWYDNIKKEMQVFHGGQLTFEYKEDDYLIKMGKEEREKNNINSTYRLLPKVEDVEIVNYNKKNILSNKNKISKWFSDYSNYNNTEITISDEDSDGIAFDVSNEEVEDFIYSIERNNFNYMRE
jgi:hypothetical protein